MPQITFEGDWDDRQISQITALVKSVAMGDSGLEDLTPPTLSPDLPRLLSARQRKLLELLRSAGDAALDNPDLDEAEAGTEADEPIDWDQYQLSKAAVGALRIDPKTGKQYQLNQNRRWQNMGVASASSDRPRLNFSGAGLGATGNFQFPPIDGEFGRGVYFLVLDQPSGHIRLRARLNLQPDEIINEDHFEELEQDLASNLDLILDSKGVKAIQRSIGDKTVLLCVRNPHDIIPLGIVGGSGDIPHTLSGFGIVAINPFADHWIVDIEMMGDEPDPLAKAARKTLPSSTHLNGTKLILGGQPIDRGLVREAIGSAQSLGADFAEIMVSVLRGVPDFLPPDTVGFAMPADRAVHLCPHDPTIAIGRFVRNLSDRLNRGIEAGAVEAQDALRLVTIAATLTSVDWLRLLILRYVGIVKATQSSNVLSGDLASDWSRYVQLLGGRGVQYWGNRQTIAYCMGEDYRCLVDPAGLPNLMTLEWDLAVGAIARMSQQTLGHLLQPANSPIHFVPLETIPDV